VGQRERSEHHQFEEEIERSEISDERP